MVIFFEHLGSTTNDLDEQAKCFEGFFLCLKICIPFLFSATVALYSLHKMAGLFVSFMTV